MKRARDAYPEKYAAAVARKKARLSRAPSVRSIVRSEMRKTADWRFSDVTGQGDVTNDGTFVNLLGSLSRGDNGINNFEGNYINPQGLRLKYSITTDQQFNHVRVLVFQWFDSSTPAVLGVLESNATTLACLSPINTTNLKQVRVLYDKTHVINRPDAGSVAVAYDTVYIPGKRMKQIRFNSTTTAVQDGKLWMLLISDDAAINFPRVNYYSRLTFPDA